MMSHWKSRFMVRLSCTVQHRIRIRTVSKYISGSNAHSKKWSKEKGVLAFQTCSRGEGIRFWTMPFMRSWRMKLTCIDWTPFSYLNFRCKFVVVFKRRWMLLLKISDKVHHLLICYLTLRRISIKSLSVSLMWKVFYEYSLIIRSIGMYAVHTRTK